MLLVPLDQEEFICWLHEFIVDSNIISTYIPVTIYYPGDN